MSDRISQLLDELTLEEKIALLAGADVWSTVPVERLGIPSIQLADGPNGIRGSDEHHGPRSPSTPVGVALGASFDPELVREVGTVLADAVRAGGGAVLLGPTMNIPRVPLAGRNFECLSEDPVVSGVIAAAYVEGVQSRGVAACVKHVVCNDQETDRFSIDARVDARALREVYLEPFRIAIEQAGPWAAMSAYNTVNGTTASEHPLLDDIVRAEYGFDGLVVSDWYGTYSPGAVVGGIDLEMPGPPRWVAREHVDAALDAGLVTVADIDRKVGRLLQLIERVGASDGSASESDLTDEARVARDRDVARRAAVGSTVLLENDGILPLTGVRRVAVIGDLARRTPVMGGGSSGSHRPERVVSILEGLRTALGEDVEVDWALGTEVWREPPVVGLADLSHGGEPGLRVEYFDGTDLEGEPFRTAVLERSHLGYFGPRSHWLDHARFSARISGTYTPSATGAHRLMFRSFGRARMQVDGDVVVDAWDETTSHHLWEQELRAGEPVEVVVEYGAVPDQVWREATFGIAPPSPGDPIAEAVDVARDADVAIVVAGLGGEWESEGYDRPSLVLPGDQDQLIAAVAEAQPDTIVVLTSGSPVELPWLDEVRAVVQAWYGGQEVGHAVGDVLTGVADPGGRLPITWPSDSGQHPALEGFPGADGTVEYVEGVHVGYRAYDRHGLTPPFAFGHGRSYATFEASDVEAEARGSGAAVHVTLQNTAARDGSEVVLVFARDIGGVSRRVVGFRKTRLAAGEQVELEVEVPADRLRWWDPATGSWVAATGTIELDLEGTFGRRATTVDLPERG